MILLAHLLRRRAVSVQEHDVPADAVGDWASEVSTQRAIADIFEDAVSFLDSLGAILTGPDDSRG